MNFQIFIAPHERHEAVEAYGRYLTQLQVEWLLELDDGESVMLTVEDDGATPAVLEVVS